jgi:hypothetical protein
VLQDLKVGYNFQTSIKSGGLDLLLRDPQQTMPSDVGVLEGILKYYENHRVPISAKKFLSGNS